MKEKLFRIGLPVAAILASIGVGFAGITSAQTASTTSGFVQHMRGMWGGGKMNEMPGVFGKVTAVNSNTITVSEQKPGEAIATDYLVDATNAKMTKGTVGAAPTTITVADIAVGDMVAVRGTVSGTSVTATAIMDGLGMMRGPGGQRGSGFGHGTAGTVTAVSGNTITLTGKDGKSYTIDASGAQIGKVTTITVGDVQVGDMLNVSGTVSGQNVTAKHIMDGNPPAPQQ